MPRRWSPSPVMSASLCLHGLGAAGLAAEPAAWPQLLGALACNHALLACGMHPRSGMLGRNLTRLPGRGVRGVAITFDDGPHPEVTPRVLDILDTCGARATFFVIGERAARHASLVREIVRRGHAVENHTQRHPVDFATWGPSRRSPLLDPVLVLEGLSLVSWTRRGYDTVSRRPELILRRLTRGLADGDILLLHDATAKADGDGVPVVLTVLPRLIERIAAAGLRTATLLDGEVPTGGRDAGGAMRAGAAAPACPVPGGHA